MNKFNTPEDVILVRTRLMKSLKEFRYFAEEFTHHCLGIILDSKAQINLTWDKKSDIVFI